MAAHASSKIYFFIIQIVIDSVKIELGNILFGVSNHILKFGRHLKNEL